MSYKTIYFYINPVKQQYRNGVTAEVGCGVSSSAMVANFFNGTNLDYEAAKALNDYQDPMQWTTFGRRVNLSSFEKKYEDYTFESLKKILFNILFNEHIPVVVRVAKGENGHYVVVNGFEGDLPVMYDEYGNPQVNLNAITPSMFKVVDPWPTWTDQNKNLQKVLDAKGSGFDLYGLYIYRR